MRYDVVSRRYRPEFRFASAGIGFIQNTLQMTALPRIFRKNRWYFFVIPFFLLAVAVSQIQGQVISVAEITVDPGSRSYFNIPVSAPMDGVNLGLHKGELQLFEITGGGESAVSSQLRAGNTPRLVWLLEGETEPGEIRRFELRVVPPGESGTERDDKGNVFVKDNGEQLRVSVGEKPVLNYRYAVTPPPEGVDPVYGRGGYIHPLWSPGGEILSRIQPPDHYHHYGIWNPWTRTEFEGREIDFWNLGEGQGTVRAIQVVERIEGEVYGGFRTVHDHVDFTGPDGETIPLREQWIVDVWNADPEQKIWLVDFTSVLSPATDEPFTIKAYRYQGFSLRATEKWNDNNTTLLTSEGFDKSNANATRARWIDVNGESNAAEGRSGILFMTHPGNFNFPEQLRIWPVGANNGVENVYINFNPAQDRDWGLEPGRSYALKYRMLVYDGSLSEERARRTWEGFAKPPGIAVLPVEISDD